MLAVLRSVRRIRPGALFRAVTYTVALSNLKSVELRFLEPGDLGNDCALRVACPLEVEPLNGVTAAVGR